MKHEETYDVAIIGGGIAGLTAAILLAEAGHQVILFEQKTYPFHKVCGEYVSRESLAFLQALDLDYSLADLPDIRIFRLTTEYGEAITRNLDLGGIGISRYTLDNLLQKRARALGAVILDSTRVKEVTYSANEHQISSDGGQFRSRVVLGAFGKRSLLDKQLNREFIRNPPPPEKNYLGVKYHLRTDFPRDTIELHVFRNGYCGISAVDGKDRYCLCYLTTAENLRQAHGDIKVMEESILSKNEYLYQYLQDSDTLYDEPLTISQINFQSKSLVSNHILMLGDAARLVAPLSGNGMSMAMHAAAIAAPLVHNFLAGDISQSTLEQLYIQQWKKHFRHRVWLNKSIQRLFFRQRLINSSLRMLDYLPYAADLIIRGTHGKSFEKPRL